MKVCEACGFIPAKMDETEPAEPVEDCPQCGGEKTLKEETAGLDEDQQPEK